MARGPYQGTWRGNARPTVVTAPDALVYFNGESDIIGCPSCQRRFDFNKYITSIQVDLNVDSPPGNATINLSIPRHSLDEFFFEGTPLISNMMEIEIFSKGFFLVEGMPQYYPIFWGIVTEVTDNYSGGEHTVTINCADILKWWEVCRININPAFTHTSMNARNLFGNVFYGTNPYDVIWSLAQQAFGDVVIATGSLISLRKEAQQKQTFATALSDIMQYWQKRFSKIRSNLLLYGVQGNAVRGDVLYSKYAKKGDKTTAGSQGKERASLFASQAVRQANGGKDTGSQMVFDPTDPGVIAFRTQFMNAGDVNFFQSEYQTKLELANAAKEAIGFEFYMDVTGDIVFKPPFYNLDIIGNKPVSWIQDIDIIDWNFSESEAEVVTQLQIQGSFGGNIDYGLNDEFTTPSTSVTDYHLLRKYGWRPQTYNSEFLGDTQLMFYVGMDVLDRLNAKRFHGTVNIPHRPELRLGFPVYIAPKDQVWYIQGISHNITFGGRAQTTLTLTAKREKFIAPRGIGTIELTGYSGAKGKPGTKALDDQALSARQLSKGGRFRAKVGDAAQIPPTNKAEIGESDPYEPLILRHPKTGRMLGYPNVVLAYTRPFQEPPEVIEDMAGQRRSSAPRPAKAKGPTNARAASKETVRLFNEGAEDKLWNKHIRNRYSYGLNSAGVYTYLHDKTKVVKDVIITNAKNIEFGEVNDKLKFQGSAGMIRPVSDERGFEVIGHFRYGRGVSLRDGSLVLSENPTDKNKRAEIRQQVAIGGSLHATLEAQSQGLATFSNTTDPATALALMSVEDQQTAATINPEDPTKYQMEPWESSFVRTAPLGTVEQAGAVDKRVAGSVEASQLSRALTLAEMGVREAESPKDTCECLLGRSDLAFINVGYQIRPLSGSAADTTSIDLGAIGITAPAETVQKAQEINAEYQKKLADQAQEIKERNAVSGTDPTKELELAAKNNEEERLQALAAIGANDNILSEALAEGKPVSGTVFSRSETMTRVETFLANLFQTLDKSHIELERALRGELIQQPFIPTQPTGGNPIDLANQAKQALEQLGEAPDNFAERIQLTEEGERLQQAIDDLERQLSELRSSSVQEALDKARQDLANVKLKLNTLD